jgi:hypothetical protein
MTASIPVKSWRPGRRGLRGGFALVLMLAVGCGSEIYRERLQETITYLEYQGRISRELGPEWSGKNVRFQPPRQFELMPPPQGQSDGGAGSAPIDASEDPRQPHYLDIELPGLVAAWEAHVEADTGDGPTQHSAYLYLLSNYDRFVQQQDGAPGAGDPDNLIADFENRLCRAIGVVLPEGNAASGTERNVRYRELVPGGLPNSNYSAQQEFTGIQLAPARAVTDVPVEMQVYQWAGRNTQIVMLMVSPQGLSPHEALHDRLLLALETFRVSDQLPTRPALTSSPGGAGSRRRTSY